MKSHPSYEMVAVISHGRLASVYRARDLVLKREVAIKELNDEARRDERLLQHFWDEARFLANIEHDNVVQIYGLDQERGWVIMELAASGLNTTIDRSSLLPDVVRGVLRQVLDGLDCLHRQGHIHGAIKPANLLVSSQGFIKLSDTTGVVDTRDSGIFAKYIAPEQLDPSFGPIGPGVDLYCLGFTALELLIGPGFSDLFPGVSSNTNDSEAGWRRFHSDHDQAMPPAVMLIPDLPADLARTIDRLLQKDVASRYDSAASALKDLDDVLSPPVPADPSPATIPPGKLLPLTPPGSPATVHGRGASPTDHSGIQGRETLLATAFPVPQSPSEHDQSHQLAMSSPPPGQSPAALETVRDDLRYPRWSRRWINQKLESPWIFYPVCGTIAFVAVLLLADFFTGRRANLSQTVEITSAPKEAEVYIDDVLQPAKTNDTFHLNPGQHHVRVKLEGFAEEDQTVDIHSGSQSHDPIHFVLKRLPDTKSIASHPEPKKTEPIVVKPNRAPDSFALLIGVRTAAEGLPVFRHAPSDMTVLGRLLTELGYKTENVTVLAQTSKVSPSKFPEAKNIHQAVRALVKDRIPGDTLLLALAGPSVVTSSEMACFCPVGADLNNPATLVALHWIFQQLADCPAETKVVLIDGNRIESSFPSRSVRPAHPENHVPPGVAALLATEKGKPGYVHATQRHGAFWAYVLRGLRGYAADAEHKVTIGSLARYVTEATAEHVDQEYKAKQTPISIAASAKISSSPLAEIDSALQHFHEGDELLEKKDYKMALEQYDRALSMRKDLVEAYLHRAVSHYRLKQYDSMIADCNEALRLDPGNPSAMDYLGDGHRAKAGPIKKLDLDEMNQAIDNYTAAIATEPDYAPFYNSRGAAHASEGVYLRSKDPQKAKTENVAARDDYSRAIELTPIPRARYFENRGKIYYRLGNDEKTNNDKAVEDYNAALELSFTPDASLYYNRGLAQMRRNDPKAALKDFNEVVRLTPDDPEAYRALATALKKLGRNDDARKAEEMAEKLKRQSSSGSR